MMGPSIATGSTLVFMRKWDTIQAMELIEREKVTLTGGVPTIAWQLLEHPDRDKYDLSSLNNITYGGAPAAPEPSSGPNPRRIQIRAGNGLGYDRNLGDGDRA